jgi:hypothetical protein
MSDEPTTKNRPSTPQESSTKGAPSSSIKIGDPKHRDIGDRDDESAKRSSHSNDDSAPDEQGEDDGGEGYKGPRADATKPAPDKHVQGEHSKSSGQQGQQGGQQSKQGQQQQQPKQGQQQQQGGQSQQSKQGGGSSKK